MSFLDGRAIRDWCRQIFQQKDDLLRTVESVTENTEEGKSVDALIIKEVFQSVSDGKTLIASAITDKGVSTDAGATFSAMAENVRMIQGGGSGEYPITSPYEFVLNWNFAVSSAGTMTQAIYFPIQKLKKFIIRKLYFYMKRVNTNNSVSLSFSIYGTKKESTGLSTVRSYYVSISSSAASNTGANITDLEIDLSEWEEINYCVISKSNSSGTFTYANVTLQFIAELYF